MGLTRTDFYLAEDLAKILATDLRNKTMAESYTGEKYFISTLDLGDGLLMTNGKYANPLIVEEAMALPKLAPDLDYITSLVNPDNFTTPTARTASLDGTSGFVVAISESGKYAFSALQIVNNLA